LVVLTHFGPKRAVVHRPQGLLRDDGALSISGGQETDRQRHHEQQLHGAAEITCQVATLIPCGNGFTGTVASDYMLTAACCVCHLYMMLLPRVSSLPFQLICHTTLSFIKTQ